MLFFDLTPARENAILALTPPSLRTGSPLMDLSKFVLLTATPEASKLDGGLKMGTVKMWTDRGYGFLRREDVEDDIFVHLKEIRPRHCKPLMEGDVVQFKQAVGKMGKPVAKEVRRISSLHLAFADPLPADTKPGDMPGFPTLEIIDHPKVEKRGDAPYKLRVKSSMIEVASARRDSDGAFRMLFNRTRIMFQGAPSPSYTQWEKLAVDIPGIQRATAALSFLDVPRMRLSVEKQKALATFRKMIVDFLVARKTHRQSTRISELRAVLPKVKFNPRPFGFTKFRDFLATIKEIEFVNQNKIRLRDRTQGAKRSRDAANGAEAVVAAGPPEKKERVESKEVSNRTHQAQSAPKPSALQSNEVSAAAQAQPAVDASDKLE